VKPLFYRVDVSEQNISLEPVSIVEVGKLFWRGQADGVLADGGLQ